MSAKPSLSLLLHRCSQRADEMLGEQLTRAGLTPRQLVVLEAIHDSKGTSQTELVAVTGIDRSTLAGIVFRLTMRNLITRARLADDHRTNELAITKQGISALRLASGASARADAKLLASVSGEARSTVLEALNGIAGGL